MRERLTRLLSAPAMGFAAFAALAGFALAAFAPQIFHDGDTWWHLAAGNWMLAHGAVPRQDVFSFSLAGAPWDAQEWLGEIFMALSWRGLSWTGLHLLFGAAMGLTVGVTAFALRRRMDFMPALVALVLGLGLVTGSLLARPHLLALPLLALWVGALVRARAQDRAPSWWLLPAMALWANIHGSFALGLALAAALGVEAVLYSRPRAKAAQGWSLFMLAAIAMALLTPQGLQGLLFPFKLLAMPGIGGIGEWRPSDVTHLNPLTLALLAAIVVFASGKMRVPVFRGLMVLGLVYLALAHVRHQMILGVAGPLLLAPYLGAAWPARKEAPSPWPGRAAAALLLVLVVARLMVPAARAEDRVTPVAALAQVPAALRARPVLNAYDYGGYLIFAGTKVFIDGRTDMYGDAFLKNYDAVAAGDPNALARTLARYRIAWTIFPTGSPTARALDRMAGWHRLGGNANAVVHVRQ